MKTYVLILLVSLAALGIRPPGTTVPLEDCSQKVVLASGDLGQDPAKAPDFAYEYKSFAIDSILSSANEGAKLPDIEERVTLLVQAAQILPASHRDDAIRFLNLALSDLKDWTGDKDKKWRRSDSARLRDSILSVYARLDPDRALVLQKESQSAGESGSDRKELQESIRGPNWTQNHRELEADANATASLAFSLIDSNLEKASNLIVQSISTGFISRFVLNSLDRLAQDHNRTAIDRLELAMLPVFLSSRTLDPFSAGWAASLMDHDPDMQANIKRGLITFVMSSIENWSQIARGADGGSGVDASYLHVSFVVFSSSVRPSIARHAPDELPRLDILLEQVLPMVPEHERALVLPSRPETATDPKDRLADILRDPNAVKRDERLVQLLFEVLRRRRIEASANIDLAADVVAGMSDPDCRVTFGDLVTITRINALVKGQKFIEAQRLASAISSDEARAWALLALGAAAGKSDRVVGFELTSNALKVLESTSPTPKKVELALAAVVMLAKEDPQRAFDTLSVAARYANSSPSQIAAPSKPPVAFGVDAAIGDARVRLGVFPVSLGDIAPDHSLAALGATDWFLSQQIANSIREASLRLRLKLLFAEGVLTAPPKPKMRAPAKT